jgi:hypothetical protein
VEVEVIETEAAKDMLHLFHADKDKIELLGHFWPKSCISPAQMMRNILNFDNQQK